MANTDTFFLPVFPLQLVAFPGETVPLHIFEPRYRELIRECQETGTTFGLPAFIDSQLMDVGAEMKLLSVDKVFPGGEMDVKTKAIDLFEIEEFHRSVPGKLYSGAHVRRLEFDTDPGDIGLGRRILDLLQELFGYLQVDKRLPEDPAQLSLFKFGHQIGLSLEEEYQLLSLPTEEERQLFVLEHLQTMVPKVKETEELRRKAQMNGHYKNLIPPKF
jgi:ATP-dependent Lon protease